MSQAGEKISQSSKKGATKSDKLVKNCHKIMKKKSWKKQQNTEKIEKVTNWLKGWQTSEKLPQTSKQSEKIHKLVKKVKKFTN